MKKTLAVLSLVVSLSSLSMVSVFAEEAQVKPAFSEANPGILPTNPFYFLKEFGRGVKMFFIFDSVSKIDYQLDVLNDKAAELSKISDLNPSNAKAIERAITNYTENATRLRNQLASLKETSNNPNVDKLLKKLDERVIKHNTLFDDLKQKNTDLSDSIDEAESVLNDIGNKDKEKFGDKILEPKEENQKNTDEAKSNVKTNSREFEIVITKDGFSPKETKIKKGDAITWINKGDSPSWPASAFHPTHDVYPEKGGCIASKFDACKDLVKGESFRFVFNYAGSWSYHDHLNPKLFGKIIVE